MKRETTTIKRRRQPAPKVSDYRSAKLYSLMFVCLMLVGSASFFVARKHFSTVDYSMRNSMLRKQLEALESEKRRLLVVREVSLSPAEIKKAAKKLGVVDADADGAQLASDTKDTKPAFPADKNSRTVGGAQPAYVTKTAYVAATDGTPAAVSAKPGVLNRGKKDKVQLASIVAYR